MYESISSDDDQVNPIEEILYFHGIDHSSKEQFFRKARRLELFFSGFLANNITNFIYFANLKEIKIIGQDLGATFSAEILPQCLQTLWISECTVKEFIRMSYLINLEHLYLYDNGLKSVQFLENVGKLRTLFLNDNSLTDLNLHDPTSYCFLEKLNISGNRFRSLPQFLSNLVHLIKLDVSGNFLWNIDDFAILSKIPSLSELTVHSPQYSKNPFCIHPNFTSLVLLMIPQLKSLNRTDSNLNLIREKFCSLFETKSEFYYFKCKTVASVFGKKLHKVRNLFLNNQTKCLQSLKSIKEWRNKCSICLEYIEDPEIIQAILEHIKFLDTEELSSELRLENIRKTYLQESEYLHVSCDLQMRLNMLELTSFGNILINSVNRDKSYVELIKAFKQRFCTYEVKSGITSVQLNNAWRIKNFIFKQQLETSSIHFSDYESKFDRNFWILPVEVNQITKIENILRSNVGIVPENILLHFTLNTAHKKLFYEKNKVLNDKREDRFYAFFCCLYDERVSKKNCLEFNCCLSHQIYQVSKPFTAFPMFLLEYEFIYDNDSVHSFEEALLNFQIEGYKDFSPSSTEKTEMINKTLQMRNETLFELKDDKIADFQLLDFIQLNNVPTRVLDSMRFITILSLRHCNLLDLEALNLISNNLIDLDLEENNLTDLSSLPFFPKLRILNINLNSFTDPTSTARQLKTNSCVLEDILASFNPWTENLDCVIKHFAYNVVSLKRFDNINLSNLNVEIDDMKQKKQSIFQLAQHFGGFKDLNQSWWIELIESDITHNSTGLILECLNFNKDHTVEEDNYRKIETFIQRDNFIYSLLEIVSFSSIRFLNLDKNSIDSLKEFQHMTNLEYLSLCQNKLTSLEGIKVLTNLRSLNVSYNKITIINSQDMICLKDLKRLSLDGNMITNVEPLSRLLNLKELYISNNQLNDIQNLLILHSLNNLSILDCIGNPVVKNATHFTHKVIFHFRSLKAFNGQVISLQNLKQAKELLEGKLTDEYLIEYIGNERFSEICRLELPNRNIKVIKLNNPHAFYNLTTLNIENNNLTNFYGFINLDNLQVLCLNQNKIESFFPKLVLKSNHIATEDYDKNEVNYFYLKKLEILHLAQNNIKSLIPLQLHRFPSLISLFLQSNELIDIQGIEGLPKLRDLVLDHNRIRCINEVSFLYNWNLTELHLEMNRLKDIRNINHLEKLTSLYLANNKLCDLNDIENNLSNLKSLRQITIAENPISKKPGHYCKSILILTLNHLQIIDGKPISVEDRHVAESFNQERFFQQQMIAGQECNNHELNNNRVDVLPKIQLVGPLPTTLQMQSIHQSRFMVPVGGGMKPNIENLRLGTLNLSSNQLFKPGPSTISTKKTQCSNNRIQKQNSSGIDNLFQTNIDSSFKSRFC